VRTSDITVGASALLLSIMPFDLFPGPTALLGLLVGGTGVVETRRGHAVGRRLLAVFAGMVLARVVIAVLAYALH